MSDTDRNMRACNQIEVEQQGRVKTGKKQAVNYSRSLAPWSHGTEPPAPFRPTKKPFDQPPLASLTTRKMSTPTCQPSTLKPIRSKKRFDQPSSIELWVTRNHLTLIDMMQSSKDPVMDSLRLQVKQQGENGIFGLASKLRIMDASNSGTLDFDEFCKAIKECQLPDLSKKAREHLFRYFDSNDLGYINYDELMIGIRGVLKTRRKEVVTLVFDTLNSDQSGVVDIVDVRKFYNASYHPDVIRGLKTENEVLVDFFIKLEGNHRDKKNGIITLNDFESYYSNISFLVDDDDQFELTIRSAWQMSGEALM